MSAVKNTSQLPLKSDKGIKVVNNCGKIRWVDTALVRRSNLFLLVQALHTTKGGCKISYSDLFKNHYIHNISII